MLGAMRLVRKVLAGGLGTCSERRRPTSRRAILQVESLEARDVPTVVFLPHFGPQSIALGSTFNTMQHPTVNLVFSGNYWTTAQGQQDEAAMLQAVQSLLSSPYLSGLTEYGSDGVATFGQSWVDTATVPANPDPTNPFPTSAAVQNFLQNSITQHNAGPGDHDIQHAPLYVVISDPASGGNQGGGWNEAGTYSQSLFAAPPTSTLAMARLATGFGGSTTGIATQSALVYGPTLYNAASFYGLNKLENIHMVWVGAETYSNDTHIWLDGFTSTVSHEVAETMTDPDGHGVHVNTPAALPLSIKGSDQIGDNEPAADRYGYRLGGVWVQPYWSQQKLGFIVPDGNSQTMLLDPIWNGDQFTSQYNLKVQGDQFGVNFADDIKIANLGGVSVTLNNQTAKFEKGAVRAINVDSRGGANTVEVYGVPYGATLNLDSTSIFGNDAVVIGQYHLLTGVLGTVNVNYTTGRSTLFLDDASDIGTKYTVTDHSVTSVFATINYRSAFVQGGIKRGVTALTLNPGHWNAEVNVVSVGALTDTTIDVSASDVIYGLASGQVHLVLV
jgi:hypothetical protein